ncbi:MAG: UDP-galactopyranose mutase [bacterium]|nr:UDP-galactopyranose mutase [bacterium]
MYDYLVVGAGLFGSVFAYEASRRGKKCLVIDKRNHVAGNIYTKEVNGINVHEYGAHIFHTSNKEIWEYVNQFAEFNRYTNSPVARYKDELYNLPFNMNTFHALWGVKTPEEAKEYISRQIANTYKEEPANLEEQALNLVGKDIYEKLIKGYTEKQWGKQATELPSFIIKRLPVRFTYDNNYFNDKYQGIPEGGYTKMIEKMLEGIEVRLNTDYFSHKKEFDAMAHTVVYTGMIDQYYEYCYGALEYRSLRFETEQLPVENYQGNAVVNYTEYEVPYTRIIEHKHFEFNTSKETIITREYPKTWKLGDEPYYPINDEKNMNVFSKYQELAAKETNVIFGGRLANYQYFDMHNVIEKALNTVKEACSK